MAELYYDVSSNNLRVRFLQYLKKHKNFLKSKSQNEND